MTAARDAIVIGAGVNGLVAAHYLARRGRRVTVLEPRRIPDTTLETGWVPPVVARELGLAPLDVALPDPWITAPPLELFRDVAKSAAAIRRISPADAGRWPDFCARMHRLASVLERLYLAPPPDIETRAVGELLGLASLGWYVRRLGKQAVIDLARILPMSIAELLDDWFESDVLKGALGALGIWHLRQGPRGGGTAFNFLHHHVGSSPGVFRPTRSNIRQLLETSPGITIRRAVGPCRVMADGGRVRGVRLESGGEILAAPLVVSSADPRTALRDVAGELDPEIVRAAGNIKARNVVARGTVTLDRPAAYSTLCHAPSLDYLERAYDAVKYGRDSDAPYVEASRANGQLEVHIQYVATRDAAPVQARVARILGVPPGQVRLDIPPEGEHLYHGELTLDQILFMRPVPGWSRYRTPVRGLYLCGPGTHPGGGIAGAAGRNAAREILKGD
jgi:phytoene dehydrogenase-like protein